MEYIEQIIALRLELEGAKMTQQHRLLNLLSIISGYVLAISVVYLLMKVIVVALFSPTDYLIPGVISFHDIVLSGISIYLVTKHLKMLPKY